jgi:hypothetical protein
MEGEMHDSINSLQKLMIDGGGQLFDIAPLALKNVIEQKLWVGRKDKNGAEFKSFEEFVGHIRWQGLETTIEELLYFCRKHPDVQKLLQAEVPALAEHGGHKAPQPLQQIQKLLPKLTKKEICQLINDAKSLIADVKSVDAAPNFGVECAHHDG